MVEDFVTTNNGGKLKTKIPVTLALACLSQLKTEVLIELITEA